jgi:hypothetical protein
MVSPSTVLTPVAQWGIDPVCVPCTPDWMVTLDCSVPLSSVESSWA